MGHVHRLSINRPRLTHAAVREKGVPSQVKLVFLMPRAPRTLLIAPAAAALLALVGCGSAEQAASAAPPVVSVALATSGGVQLTDTLPGRVAALRVAEIRPQVSGVIQRRLFTEGAVVRTGQPLYQIDPAPFRAEAASAAAALRRAESIRDSARIQRDRLQPLLEADAVSQQAFDDAEAALSQAEAEVGVARANLARRNLDVGFSTVKAPIGGRIGASRVTEGALVNANGGEALATVNQIDQVYIDVFQPASRMEALRELGAGSTVVQLLDDAGRPLGVTGRLLFSELVVDPATGDMRARVLVDNAAARLYPGMFVRVSLPRGPEQSLLRVPQQAVFRAAGQSQVMVVSPDGKKVETRAVEVGDVYDNQYVVRSGLSAGDRVVVEGRDRVRPGAPVTAQPWRPAVRTTSPAA